MWQEKLNRVRAILDGTSGVVVAFSGGVDSTLLAAVSHERLGDRALAVTALSPTYPAHEQAEAAELAKKIGIRHRMVESNELEIPGYAQNPVNRCYHCKSELFRVLRGIADVEGLRFVADGTNADDIGDYRPGRRAASEQGVISPLLEAGMTKEDIRAASRLLGLPTADKPAYACLASRFPYGTPITESGLAAVDRVEEALRALGFSQVRARCHGDVARIEVLPSELERLAMPSVREAVLTVAREAGFRYAAADLQGYRTGSMNEGVVSGATKKNEKSC